MTTTSDIVGKLLLILVLGGYSLIGWTVWPTSAHAQHRYECRTQCFESGNRGQRECRTQCN